MRGQLEKGEGGGWELEMTLGVAGQGAEKAGRRGESPFSHCLEQGHGVYGYVGFAGGHMYQHTHANAPFPLPDSLKGRMDPYRMSFGAVLGSLLKKTLAVVHTVYPRWGLK